MTAEQLIAVYRAAAQDAVQPYLTSDDAVLIHLAEAEDEAAKRARLIHDDSTAAVCEIEVLDVSGTIPHTYTLHASLYELTAVRLFTPADGEPVELVLKSREWLDRARPGWRESTEDPEFAIQNDTTLRIVPAPKAEGLLRLEGYRLPLAPIDELASVPEISAAHHRHLVQWVLHRVFLTPDTELFDPARSARALAEFERYFGPPVDSDLRRATRIDIDHHNLTILP